MDDYTHYGFRRVSKDSEFIYCVYCGAVYFEAKDRVGVKVWVLHAVAFHPERKCNG